MSTPWPTWFISHGGGPWPWIAPMRERLGKLEQSLRAMTASLPGRPRAVLMVSGHWEASAFTVMSSPQPGMVYDYSGFPEHTYRIRYPAPGAPEVAAEVRDLIERAGLPAATDAERGFDHGTFAPMAVMYPAADVPTLQLSLRHGYDPAEHLALGRALAPLRHSGVLIVGSGLSWHNLRMMGAQAREPSAAFDAWLQETLALPAAERSARLVAWDKAPFARLAHPREDHLIPLHVALGAAEGEASTCDYHDEEAYGGAIASSFRFGALPAG